jgi:hypothetical protein
VCLNYVQFFLICLYLVANGLRTIQFLGFLGKCFLLWWTCDTHFVKFYIARLAYITYFDYLLTKLGFAWGHLKHSSKQCFYKTFRCTPTKTHSQKLIKIKILLSHVNGNKTSTVTCPSEQNKIIFLEKTKTTIFFNLETNPDSDRCQKVNPAGLYSHFLNGSLIKFPEKGNLTPANPNQCHSMPAAKNLDFQVVYNAIRVQHVVSGRQTGWGGGRLLTLQVLALLKLVVHCCQKVRSCRPWEDGKKNPSDGDQLNCSSDTWQYFTTVWELQTDP